MNFEDWAVEAWVTVAVCVGWLVLFGYLLAGLRSEEGLSKPKARPRITDRLFATIGVFMSALDDALARFTAFVKDVVTQLTATKDTNATQTGKIAELQAALDAALSDDAADKAAISALQTEISGLQDSVAAQIDATLDALANPPVEVVADEVVADEVVAVDEVVTVDEVAENDVKDSAVE